MPVTIDKLLAKPLLHNHKVGDIAATGTASDSTYLRGDGAWATPAGSGAVDSVNGATGVVVLDAADVGAEVSGAVAAHELANDHTLLHAPGSDDQDLSGLVPYTGATTDLDLGANGIRIGTTAQFSLEADHTLGVENSTNVSGSPGGGFNIVAGDATVDQNGGNIILTAGQGGETGVGGNIEINAGAGGTTSGDSGTVTLTALSYTFNDPTGSQGVTLDLTSLTGGQTLTFPDATGTLALTSDITGTNSGTNTGDQDLSGLVLVSGDTMTGDLLNTAHLGVGGGLSAVNASYIMEANETFTQTSGEKRGLSFFVGSNPSADWATTSILGLNGFAEHKANTNALGSHFGAFFGSRNAGTSTLWVSYGGFMEVQNTSTGTCDFAVGVVASIKDSGGGDFTTAYGLLTQAEIATGGTIGTFYGAYIKNPTGAGAVTTNYGLYIQDQTKATTNYALYTNAGTNSLGDDLEFRNNSDGVILTDRTTATKYRLFVNSGTLQIEGV